jgi:hypothetical protein
VFVGVSVAVLVGVSLGVLVTVGVGVDVSDGVEVEVGVLAAAGSANDQSEKVLTPVMVA